MDWTVYWFMFPVCIGVASAAMFSGISGAAMLMPVFLIGFPLVDAPPLSAAAAVGMSLFLEAAGFGTGVFRYVRRGLVDTVVAGRLAAVTVPAGVAGALAARWVGPDVLRLGYGAAMIVLAVLLASEPAGGNDQEAGSRAGAGPGWMRELTTAEGVVYRYTPRGIGGQRVLSGLGAVLAGLISTGVGEATLPGLVRRSGFPVPVAAATSTVVVAATVTGASLTHLAALARAGGLTAIPWNLIVWAVPGAVIGAVLGTHLQGRVPQRAARRFFAVLFGAIGMLFVLLATGLGALLVVADGCGSWSRPARLENRAGCSMRAPLVAALPCRDPRDDSAARPMVRSAPTPPTTRRRPMSLAMRRGPLGPEPSGWFDAPVPDHVLYVEPCPRRIRAVFAGAVVVDTRRARLVHETGRTAEYYFPRADVDTGLLVASDRREPWPTRGRAHHWSVVVDDRRAPDAARSHPHPPPGAADLAGLVALRWEAMDAWYEEDEQVFLEPRDPYHRVDALVSSRHVRVERDGQPLADSHRPVVVFETGARTRHYLPPADVRTDLLVPASRLTRCQYKGLASYWSVRLPGGRTVADAAWTYHDPNPEAAAIVGMVCFSSRRTEVVVDGDPAGPALRDG